MACRYANRDLDHISNRIIKDKNIKKYMRFMSEKMKSDPLLLSDKPMKWRSINALGFSIHGNDHLIMCIQLWCDSYLYISSACGHLCVDKKSPKWIYIISDYVAPQIGLEPITLRLTAECSAIELLRHSLNPATTYSPGPLPAKYHQRAEA